MKRKKGGLRSKAEGVKSEMREGKSEKEIFLWSSSRYSAGIHLLFGQDQLGGCPR